MCNCTNKIKDQGFKELKDFIDSMDTKEGALISVLHKAQSIFGYLPSDVQAFIAEQLDESLAHVDGVVSFYSYFTMIPKGEHPISVCMGTACYVKGADKVLEEFEKHLKIKPGETTYDGKFSMDALRCVGACAIAPVVLVGEKVYQKVKPGDVAKILAEY